MHFPLHLLLLLSITTGALANTETLLLDLTSRDSPLAPLAPLAVPPRCAHHTLTADTLGHTLTFPLNLDGAAHEAAHEAALLLDTTQLPPETLHVRACWSALAPVAVRLAANASHVLVRLPPDAYPPPAGEVALQLTLARPASLLPAALAAAGLALAAIAFSLFLV